MLEHRPCCEGTTEEEDRANGEHHPPFGGDPQHNDEEGEEEQRRAEIALKDHHAERTGPRDTNRRKITKFKAAAQQFPRVDEVAGEERRQGEFGELAGLKVDRADACPDPSTVDLGAEP